MSQTNINTIEEKQRIARFFNGICKRLDVLKNLKEYEKIWITEKDNTHIFQIDNSYIQFFVRKWGGQSRESVISIIENDTNFIRENFRVLMVDTQKTIRERVNLALVGITNLKKTYSTHVDRIDKIISLLEKLE